MEIVETLLLMVAWFVAVVWMYGVRVRPVVVTTSLVSLLVLLVTILFTFPDFSKFHLLWAIPVTMFLSAHFFTFIILHIPILNNILVTIGKVYTEILRVGIGEARRSQLQQEFETGMTSILNDLATKKQKQHENSRGNGS